MVNGLGVLGWGVGGIEAEAALLGQPLYQPMPRIVGVRLPARCPRGSTATDLVLVVTQLLRAFGVVGAFVEFAGDGLPSLSLADRATISNMSPEFGATSTLFPIDDETLAYLRLTGRTPERVDLVERYARRRACGASRAPAPSSTRCSSWTSRPSSPRWRARGDPRTGSRSAACSANFRDAFPHADLDAVARRSSPTAVRDGRGPSVSKAVAVVSATRRPCSARVGRHRGDHLVHQHLEPGGHGRAGLLARNAVARGLPRRPSVKTSLAPGSKAVTGYLERAGLMAPLATLGFALAGYGCTTCIGNSGPLDEAVAKAIEADELVVSAVLSGNRNFEGRDPPARPRRVPRLAAARRRLRPRRAHGRRPDHGAPGHRHATASRSCSRTSGPARTRSAR